MSARTVKSDSGKEPLSKPQGGAALDGADSPHFALATVELTREMNRNVILGLIRKRQPIARVGLARASGLQNSTVSSIVEQLLTEGWIREGEAVVTARGRRPTHVSLNDRLAMLVADVHPGRAVLAAVDLNGKVLVVQTVQLGSGAQQSVQELGRALAALRDLHPERTFAGAGICLPGRIDRETGRLMIAPNLPWRQLDILGTLTKTLGMTVELENEANACLVGELWFGHLHDVQDAVLLAISEGVGASILAGGHLISGRRGMAGEFGHLCYDPAGPECGCGRMGCWEMFTSSRAALGYYREADPEAAEIDYRELCRLANDGCKPACKAIERQAEAIGRGLRMVTSALAPETIVFAGEITFAWQIAQPILERECERVLLAGSSPRLVRTADGEEAHLIGAAAVVLQRHSGYYQSRSGSHETQTTTGQRVDRGSRGGRVPQS